MPRVLFHNENYKYYEYLYTKRNTTSFLRDFKPEEKTDSKIYLHRQNKEHNKKLLFSSVEKMRVNC